MPLTVISTADFAPRSFAEARDYFLGKAPLLSSEWDRLTAAQKARSFGLAAVNQVKLLQAVRAQLATAISEGKTYREWRQEVLADFAEAGVDAPALSQLRLTYFQNTTGAHSAVRREALDEARGTFPYRKYLTSGNGTPGVNGVRPTHAALHGKVFRADDAFWFDHTPPWEWNCHCTFVGMTADQVEREQLTVWTYSGGFVTPLEASEEVQPIAVPPDPSFSTARGPLDLSQLDDDLRAAIEERMRDTGGTPLSDAKLFPAFELVLIDESAGKDTVDFVLIPDGQVKTTKGNFFIDRQAFAEVDRAFRSKGNDILVDYEHQSLGGEYAPPDGKALAAGWIKGLRYEEKKGVIATAKWTPAARQHIKSGEYRYHSPVVSIRKSDGRAVLVQSAGLTNTPAIEKLPALAAKDGPQKESKMDATKTAADPAVLVGELKAMLGIEIKDGTDMTAVLSAIRDELKKREGKPPEGTALTNVRKALGLADSASESEITVSINTLRQGKESASSFQTELTALKAKLEERDLADFLSPYVLKGVVSESNAEDFKAIRTMALSNRDIAKRWLDERVTQLGHQKPLTKDGGSVPSGDRSTIIAKAKSEFASSPTAQKVTSLKAYVNDALALSKNGDLTTDELKTLVA